MVGIPPNLVPVNASDIRNNLVPGVPNAITQAQEVAAAAVTDSINAASSQGQAVVGETIATAQNRAQEELSNITNQLQLPPDALAAMEVLNSLFSYEELSGLSIEEIRKRVESIKLAFKFSKPELPDLPNLSIPSATDVLREVEENLPKLPNESGLDAYGNLIISEIKQLRQNAQSNYDILAAKKAKNMFELRRELIEEESQKLISGFTSEAGI